MEEALRLLLSYGPGGVIAALVVFGFLVPKSFYDREVRRGDALTDTAAKTAEGLLASSAAMTTLAGTNKSLRDEIVGLKGDVLQLREDVRSARLTKDG